LRDAQVLANTSLGVL
jgi:hypothetical protein